MKHRSYDFTFWLGIKTHEAKGPPNYETAKFFGLKACQSLIEPIMCKHNSF